MILGVVHNYLFFPEVVALKAIIDAGEIGEVRSVRVDMLGVVDSPGAAGYRPLWRKDPAASGGGVLMDMLHGVYLAEHLLGEQVTAVSAFVDVADGIENSENVENSEDTVEGLALCRLEAGRRAALVNVGWGHGPGGVAVHGTKGRAIARYRADGTMPWAPFEQLTVVTEDGSGRIVDLPAGQELVPLVADAMRDTVLDLADAINGGGSPAADGAAALHTLQTTVAAYASAALQRTVTVPFESGSALHDSGVVGLTELDVPETSLPRQRGLFGLTPAGA